VINDLPHAKGDNPPWRPLNAYDDGRKVYIEFSRGIAQGEVPPLSVSEDYSLRARIRSWMPKHGGRIFKPRHWRISPVMAMAAT
jgi:type IV secretory pathway VirB9-like protein